MKDPRYDEYEEDEEDNEVLHEDLAELAHEQWSGWMEYLFSKCVMNKDGTAIIPKWAVDHCQAQIKTTFEDLSESEKESSRKEAEKMLEIMKKYY
jgi:hypothetical protein